MLCYVYVHARKKLSRKVHDLGHIVGFNERSNAKEVIYISASVYAESEMPNVSKSVAPTRMGKVFKNTLLCCPKEVRICTTIFNVNFEFPCFG
jgi:hypothetical protein